MKPIHLWAPSFDPAEGGIQSYSFELLNALALSSRVKAFPRAGQSVGLFAWKVLRSALLQRPAFIISTHLNFGPLALAIKRCLGTPYAISLHGIEAWSLADASKIRALQQADILLPVSRHTWNKASSAVEPSPARWELLPNTFDELRFQPGPKPVELMAQWGLASNQPVILTVGRMDQREKYKGHDRILAALPSVLRQIPQAVCIFVGSGTDQPRLEKMASDYGVRKSTLFAGKVPAGSLPDYYRLCDVFAMPSTGEGFGIAFLEALACGRPVISGNTDAGREVLRDGELGLLVDPDQPADLGAALLACLQKKHANPSIFSPEFLRQKAIAHYGRTVFRQRLTEIFKPCA